MADHNDHDDRDTNDPDLEAAKHKGAGEGKDLAGKVKETTGKAVGDDELKREGQADQAEGKAQKLWGKVRDAVTGKS